MDSVSRRFSAVLLAATVAAGPAAAQVAPGGVSPMTAPSYSEGNPPGGTGASVRHRHRRHHRARHHRRHTARPAATDTNSGGLSGSGTPSR